MVAAVRIVWREALATDVYLKHIEQEKNNAAEVIETVKSILENKDNDLVKMPIPLQKTADVMPLTQGIKILKAVVLDRPVDNVALSLIIICVIAVICTVLSAKFFKWE